GERIRMAPSLRRSTTTSGGPSLTGRSGGCAPITSPRRGEGAEFGLTLNGELIGNLAARDFRRAFFQKCFEPRLGFVVALRDRRRQRFGNIAGGRIAARDARQKVHHCEIGERRIAGDAVRELHSLGET